LAEPHDLAVAAAVRVEVGAALAAADGQAGQRVLEDLLEAEELHDAEVHRGMEPQAALVRAERGVVLDADAAVDLHGALVIDPGDTEDDLPLRLAQPHQDAVVLVLGVPGLDDLERLEHLPDSLMELGFSGVAVENLVVGRLERRVEHRGPFRGPGAPESRGSPRRRRSRRGPGYADTRREGTERSTSEHADPCRADTQWFCAEEDCRAGHAASARGVPPQLPGHHPSGVHGTAPPATSAPTEEDAPIATGRSGRPWCRGGRTEGVQSTSSWSGVKISSMEHPKRAAIRKASGRDGSYLSFSRAITVCRETPRALPSSAWDQRRSARRALMSLRMAPPHRYRTVETTVPASHESMRIEKAKIQFIAGSRKNCSKPTARISEVDSTKASSTASAILRRW